MSMKGYALCRVQHYIEDGIIFSFEEDNCVLVEVWGPESAL